MLYAVFYIFTLTDMCCYCLLALLQRNQAASSAEAATVNTKLLVLNPDIYSLWNYRRTLLEAKLAE